jgi:hypothetical protein
VGLTGAGGGRLGKSREESSDNKKAKRLGEAKREGAMVGRGECETRAARSRTRGLLPSDFVSI